jgi:hypothetical protein
MEKDRRKHRSEAPHEAAGLYLESVASRNNLRALTLSGEDGLLFASTRGELDCRTIAAVGAARGRYGWRIPCEIVNTGIKAGERMHTSRIDISGQTYYLTSVGSVIPWARSVEGALRRILGPALSPLALS